jgi:hypothetical protein|tara:strand:+ start:32 stop:757 length:726 start_codon:yes stop_codon:yes gene_type:complete
MWKTRADLPGLIKLDIKYDIDKLREEFKLLDHDQWNADISDSLENMRQENNRLTKKVFGWETGGAENMIKEYRSETYHQRQLTDYDETFELREDRNSGSIWDKKFYKGKKEFDERAFRKLLPDLPPYITEICESLGEHRTRVGLAKLEAGSLIDAHRDYDPTFAARYHVAIDTNEGCIFGFEQNGKKHEVHIPADGYVWFANTGMMHWVRNDGNTDRTHIIFNMDSQELLENATWAEQYGS